MPKRLAVIATNGTLDWAYPPFILGSTAAALGYEVQIFFTFYGLQLLKKKLNLKVSALGNPGMPMPLGMEKWFPVAGTAVPGMQRVMTTLMKRRMRAKGIASVEELRGLCQEAGQNDRLPDDLRPVRLCPRRPDRRDRVRGCRDVPGFRRRVGHKSRYLVAARSTAARRWSTLTGTSKNCLPAIFRDAKQKARLLLCSIFQTPKPCLKNARASCPHGNFDF